MHYPSYTFFNEPNTTEYHFESIGSNGIIHKIVVFSEAVPHLFIFNLGLADLDSKTGEMSDMTVSNNGDTHKILATIFQITVDYCQKNPNHLIAFEGTNLARNRLYRMAINHAFDDISEYFLLYGFSENIWEKFEKNKDYEIFWLKENNDLNSLKK